VLGNHGSADADRLQAPPAASTVSAPRRYVYVHPWLSPAMLNTQCVVGEQGQGNVQAPTMILAVELCYNLTFVGGPKIWT
jgi:hypothetical protein